MTVNSTFFDMKFEGHILVADSDIQRLFQFAKSVQHFPSANLRKHLILIYPYRRAFTTIGKTHV